MNDPSLPLRDLYTKAPQTQVPVDRLRELVEGATGLELRLVRYGKVFYARLADKLTDTRRATAILGRNVVRQVAVQHALITAIEERELPEPVRQRFWSDCIHRALSARLLALETELAQPEAAFTAGLALDWGIGHLLAEQGHHMQWLGEGRAITGPQRITVERELFGLDHVQVFVQQTRSWKLPTQLTTVVAAHHNQDGSHLSAETQGLLKIVGWADRLGGAITSSAAGPALEACARDIASLGLQPRDAWSIVENTLRYTPTVAHALGVPVVDQPELDDLLERRGEYDTVQARDQWAHLWRQENEQLRRQVDRLEEQLEQAHSRDRVTGLPSFCAFLDLAADAVQRAHDDGLEACLILVDLDGFTAVNARHGYAVGDKLLDLAAQRLKSIARSDNVLGRVGADDFAILVPSGARAGQVIAERARATIESMYLDEDDARIRITATVVGVTAEPDRNRDHEWLMSEAQHVRSVHASRSRNRMIWVP